MNERKEIKTNDQSLLFKLPDVIEDALYTLRHLEMLVEKHVEILKKEANKHSIYYSVEKWQSHVNQVASVTLNDFIRNSEAEWKSIKTEYNAVQNTFDECNKLQTQVTWRNQFLIDMLLKAAIQYCKHCNDVLFVNIKKISSPAPLLLACQIFSDFVNIDFNDFGRLTCTGRSVESHSVLHNAELFNAKLKKIQQEYKAKEKQTEFEKEIQVALTCIQHEITLIMQHVHYIELQFSFSKDSFNSSIQVDKANQQTESELKKLSEETCGMIERYSLTNTSRIPANYLSNKKRLVDELVRSSQKMIEIFDKSHEMLEDESKNEYKKIKHELNHYSSKINESCFELKSTIQDLKQKLDSKDMKPSYSAYLRFVNALSRVSLVQSGEQKNEIISRLTAAYARFGGEIYYALEKTTRQEFLKIDQGFHESLFAASHFTSSREKELIALEKEKLAKELVELVRDLLIDNLPYWNKQLCIGLSDYKIQKIKVPRGIANMINSLSIGNKSYLVLLAHLKTIAEDRLNSLTGCCCLFGSRKTQLSQFYQAFEYLFDIKNLNEKQSSIFKKALYTNKNLRTIELKEINLEMKL